MTHTVVGDPVQTQDGSTVIPISKVSFGFVAGGGEYGRTGMQAENELPFAGGAGAGVSVQPMGFLICSADGVRMLSAHNASPMQRIVEILPQALEKLGNLSEGEDVQTQAAHRVRAVYQE